MVIRTVYGIAERNLYLAEFLVYVGASVCVCVRVCVRACVRACVRV